MTNVLNPALYEHLQLRFRNVRVSRRGDEGQFVRTLSPSGTIKGGEEYHFNCPFCLEKRQRLYVSYLFGLHHPWTNRPNYYLWCCHNETACHRNRNNRDRFRAFATPPIGRRVSQQAAERAIATTTTLPRSYEPATEIQLPDNNCPVSDLPVDHPAIVYLHSRGFDPRELQQLWDVRYVSLFSPEAANRLLIPVKRLQLQFSGTTDGPLANAGWQARHIGELSDGTPKYLFPRGFQKTRVLYGLPQALRTQGPVVLCEGPTDVWRYGPGAMATFGLHVSREQHLLLIHHFAGWPIVILPDNGAVAQAQENAAALRSLRVSTSNEDCVTVAHLPTGRDDPAECTREELHHAVSNALGYMANSASSQEVIQ